MKYILQAFMVLLLLQSCQSDELKVSFKTIEINIPGTLGPSLKNHSKYYCYFEKDNPLKEYTIVDFYILDENGKVLANIPPPPIQFLDYNLTVRNDTIFTTNYFKNYASFYLDEKKKRWIEDVSTSNIIFKDEKYTVFNRSLGTCCSKTWFKDNKTGQQYEVFTENAIVNKLNNVYYLSTADSVLKIQDPKKLTGSYLPNPDKYLGSGSYNKYQEGTEFVYWNGFSGISNFSLATSFVVKQYLYHLYSGDGSTQIAVLKDNNWVKIFDIKHTIRPYKPQYKSSRYPRYFEFINHKDRYGSYRSPYAKMNYFPGNEYQSLQFSGTDPNRSGIIEIDKNKLNIITLKNNYQEPVLGEPYTKSWVEKNFMDFYTHFNTLSIQQIDRIEQQENALNLTQYEVCNDFRGESCGEVPRVYQKIERKYIHLITTYFYDPKSKLLKNIGFQWKTQSEVTINDEDDFKVLFSLDKEKIFRPKFEWLTTFLKQKLGEPVSEDPNHTQWETETQTVTLSYNKYNTNLILNKKQKN